MLTIVNIALVLTFVNMAPVWTIVNNPWRVDSSCFAVALTASAAATSTGAAATPRGLQTPVDHRQLRLQQALDADVFIAERKVNPDSATHQFVYALHRSRSILEMRKQAQWHGQNPTVIEH